MIQEDKKDDGAPILHSLKNCNKKSMQLCTIHEHKHYKTDNQNYSLQDAHTLAKHVSHTYTHTST